MRVLGLLGLNISVQLAIWTDEKRPISTQAAEEYSRLGVEVVAIPRHRRIREFLRLDCTGRLGSFLPDPRHLVALRQAVSAFAPCAIMADSLETGKPAALLSDELKLPLAYRSQNVEHIYWAQQARLSRFPNSVPLLLGARRLLAAESALRNRADLVLDISDDDRLSWTHHPSFAHSVTLPPTWMDADRSEAVPEATWDISFTGGLRAPNNVDGLLWFLREVLPLIQSEAGRSVRILVAGSSPTRTVRSACRRAKVDCIADPQDISRLRRASRVLINPVRFSSGVNIKMLDMIASGLPVVSTSAGARGLSRALLTSVIVTDHAVAFANACVLALASSARVDFTSARTLVRQECGPERLHILLTLARRI